MVQVSTSLIVSPSLCLVQIGTAVLAIFEHYQWNHGSVLDISKNAMMSRTARNEIRLMVLFDSQRCAKQRIRMPQNSHFAFMRHQLSVFELYSWFAFDSPQCTERLIHMPHTPRGLSVCSCHVHGLFMCHELAAMELHVGHV